MSSIKWHTEQRKVSDLISWSKNPHVMNEFERNNLSASIDKFDYVEIVIINTDNTIIGGHQRINDFKSKGKEGEVIDVRVPSRKLTEEELSELAIRLNKNRGHDDEELLRNFFKAEDLEQWGFTSEELELIYNIDEKEVSDILPSSLQERFLIPPFSVFDTRQGYWQYRKKEWSQLFNSQETRENVELIARSGQSPAIYDLRNKMRVKLGRDPDWDEIIAEAEKRGMHVYSGASVFDPVLCEVLYYWFCPAGGSVLDPFAGGSVRGIVAGMMDFDYWGIDLRKEQVDANYAQAERLNTEKMNDVVWYVGDSNKMNDLLPDRFQYDFVFSCPPYHDLEVYSEDPADLSNMEYQEFVSVYRSIITKAMERLKPNRFACFVVGDIRDKSGVYRNFVSETIDCFTKCIDANGQPVKLYNEIILINVAGSLPVRVGRQFENSRKVGKMHQNVLVFYKGDPKKIKEEFPEIKITEYLQELNYQPNIAITTTG